MAKKKESPKETTELTEQEKIDSAVVSYLLFNKAENLAKKKKEDATKVLKSHFEGLLTDVKDEDIPELLTLSSYGVSVSVKPESVNEFNKEKALEILEAHPHLRGVYKKARMNIFARIPKELIVELKKYCSFEEYSDDADIETAITQVSIEEQKQVYKKVFTKKVKFNPNKEENSKILEAAASMKLKVGLLE